VYHCTKSLKISGYTPVHHHQPMQQIIPVCSRTMSISRKHAEHDFQICKVRGQLPKCSQVFVTCEVNSVNPSTLCLGSFRTIHMVKTCSHHLITSAILSKEHSHSQYSARSVVTNSDRGCISSGL
jgi:hypothetical protein